MWVGPTQTLFLALLEEYNLPRYISYHGTGRIALMYRNQTSREEGPCWDCLILPREGENERAEPMHRAAKAATGELKVWKVWQYA